MWPLPVNGSGLSTLSGGFRSRTARAGLRWLTSRKPIRLRHAVFPQAAVVRHALDFPYPAITMGGMPQVDATIEASPVLDMGEVVALYRTVGWAAYADDAATLEAALTGSSRVVAARVDGRLVGLARVISDGATICYLQDLLVHPDTQRRGVGQALVRAALEPNAPVRQKML